VSLDAHDLSGLARYLALQRPSGTVIDVGVTRDVLPEMLRALGVQACSAADTATAVSLAVKDGCDVVVALGVAQELDERAARAAVAGMTAVAPRVLFGCPRSSMATGAVGLPSTAWWARFFAERGFYPDTQFGLGLEAVGTMMFTRVDETGQAFGILTMRQRIDERDRRIAELTGRLLAIEATLTWRLHERVRATAHRLRYGPHVERLWHSVRRTVEVVLDDGPGTVVPKLLGRMRAGWAVRREGRLTGGQDEQYEQWLRYHRRAAADRPPPLLLQGPTPMGPLVSVVILATDSRVPGEAVDTLRSQLYPHWELLVVTSDRAPGSTALADYRLHDARVKLETSTSRLTGLRAASGELIALLRPGDRLSETALLEAVRYMTAGGRADLVYTDEDEMDAQGRRRRPFFKPDWSPDLLLSLDYVSRLCVFRRQLLDALPTDGSPADIEDEYDLVLRLTEVAGQVAHIPKVLYHRTPDRPPDNTDSEAHAVERALERRGQPARVERLLLPGSAASGRIVRYAVSRRPLVSIIIPTRDRGDLLRQCLLSIAERTDYEPYEVLVLDNESQQQETLCLLADPPLKLRVVRYPGRFNYSAINNLGAREAHGEHLLFLNNDVQVVSESWLTAMVEHAERPEVGAVGAKLLYPDGTLQHAGVVLGAGGTAGHAFRRQRDGDEGYHGLAHLVRNCSAVTGACLLLRRGVFDEVGGFDERLRIDLNDVDLCLRIRSRGYLVVYTPVARLYHYEGATRRRIRPFEDDRYFWARWRHVLERGDPYYHPNLTRASEDWRLRL
jgi:GT2 family glycosyltransferase